MAQMKNSPWVPWAQRISAVAALCALLWLKFVRISAFGFTAVGFTALDIMMNQTMLMIIPIVTTATLLLFTADPFDQYSIIAAAVNLVVLVIFSALAKNLLLAGDVSTLVDMIQDMLPVSISTATLADWLGKALKPGIGFVVALLCTVAYGGLYFLLQNRVKPVQPRGPVINSESHRYRGQKSSNASIRKQQSAASYRQGKRSR